MVAAEVSSQPSLTSLSLQISIAALPILLHLIDKIIEIVRLIPRDFVHQKLRDDGRENLKCFAADRPLFEEVEAFFEFEHDAHFIVKLVLFSLFSILFAHAETAEHVTNVNLSVLAVVVILAAFLIAFLLRLLSAKIDPAAVDATRYWKFGAAGCFAITLGAEVYLNYVHHLPEAH